MGTTVIDHTHRAGHASAAAPCGCGGTGGGTRATDRPCECAELRGLERTRFFAGQLVTPADLTQDQHWVREKSRRHNRMLHGWGIVCGACVRRGRTPCEVIVEPGYILGPYGDEIVIPEEVTLDVCRLGPAERDGCCGEELDPWCGDTRPDCAAGTVYLAVRCHECLTRPVRAANGRCGCGCDESACEYSRIRESFSLKVLRELPGGYATPMPRPGPGALVPCLEGRARACPPCPADPWVVLADIEIGRDCRVQRVDCFAHRRYVVSWADFYFTCGRVPGGSTVPQPVPATPAPAGAVLGRALSAFMGTGTITDVRSVTAAEPVRAAVRLSRPDGRDAMLYAHFAVERPETVRELLAREGDREYYDGETDTLFTLREAYVMAAVPLDARVTGTASALALLEGARLELPRRDADVDAGADTGSEAEPRGGVGPALERELDRRGLDRLTRELGGATARAGELPATDLIGVSPRSALGKAVADMTIADVANADRERFVERVAAAAPARQRTQVKEHAAELWARASRVMSLPEA